MSTVTPDRTQADQVLVLPETTVLVGATPTPLEALALAQSVPSAFLPRRPAVPVAPPAPPADRRRGLRSLTPVVGSLTGYAGLLVEHWDELDDTVRRALVERVAVVVTELQAVTERLVEEERAAAAR